MKKIFLIISVTLFFCNSVFADWEKFGDAEEGAVYYVEKDTIIKESGYIYFWKMVDYTKPFLDSNFYSAKVYIKGDCKVKKIKTLTYVFYTGKKGTGESEQQESVNKNWKYPTPESIDYSLLKKLC